MRLHVGTERQTDAAARAGNFSSGRAQAARVISSQTQRAGNAMVRDGAMGRSRGQCTDIALRVVCSGNPTDGDRIIEIAQRSTGSRGNRVVAGVVGSGTA